MFRSHDLYSHMLLNKLRKYRMFVVLAAVTLSIIISWTVDAV
jgi:hypothetical protein